VTTYLAVVPGVLALLPVHRGRVDPVAELRAACREAVSWLAERCPSSIAVTADPSARSRAMDVATSLLAEAGYGGRVVAGTRPSVGGQLIVANGSARRGEKAPGHLDPRSFDFDAQIEAALVAADAPALGQIDLALGHALLAEGLEGLRSLASLAPARIESTMLYADDPYGVRYWVVTWECVS